MLAETFKDIFTIDFYLDYIIINEYYPSKGLITFVTKI